MRVGDLARDREDNTLALILAIIEDQLMIYYITGDVKGDVVYEDHKEFETCFTVVGNCEENNYVH